MAAIRGDVDWSGENPGMYLREQPDGPFTCLASFFRVVLSPHGPGHAAFVLMDPSGEGSPATPNACYTDNEALARRLARDFVAHFAAFRGNPNLDRLTYRPADRFVHEGSHTTAWREIVTGPGVHLELTWGGLYDTFALDVPPERSATGRHRMLSLFVSAREGTCELNGVRGAGQPTPRDAFGRQSSTAFLAFSETWIVPAP
ncbi:MAG TPA: hypothetical protein VGM69_18860 [Chloroflexota bacterium]|jgi:hypothetical protein